MIIDTLDHLYRYCKIHPNLDRAIQFIQKTDLNTLPVGKIQIDGDEVFVNVSEGQTSPEDGRSYEYHKHYADLHLDLSGAEIMRVCAEAPIADLGKFDEENDGGLCQVSNTGVSVCLGENLFGMAFPMEPHIPMIPVSDAAPIRKCVFKIRMF